MKVLVVGGTGFVGSAVASALAARGHAVWIAARGPFATDPPAPRAERVDLRQPGSGAALVARVAPDAVVNAAALADIGPCARDPRTARRLNAELAGELARACAAADRRLVHLSTDQVFDGSRGRWTEADAPRPLHAYGATKWAGERAVLAACPAAALLRAALVTGAAPPGRRSSSSSLLATLAAGRSPRMFTDEIRSPIAAVDLARAVAALLEDADAAGTFHAGGAEDLSRYALARREAGAAGLDPARVLPGTRREAGMAAERPADLSLDSSRLCARLGWTPRVLA